MNESMMMNNTYILHQIVKEVLKKTVNDISQIDLNELVQTSARKPDKDNKSVQRFISKMQDRHIHEKAEAQRLIKKDLMPEPYLY